MLRWAVAGSVLVSLAFPPLEWSYLAWVTPVLWLRWIHVAQLPGTHPYRTLWLAGFVFWLLVVHWIRLPHPLNYIAWVVLAAYLGAYLPVFMALSRVGVQRYGLPLWLVAPVAWTGLDWLRGNLMTGFLMGSLAHTQVGHPLVIQIASLAGEYGVTFLIVLVAACLTQSLHSYPSQPARIVIVCLIPAVIGVAATLLYGSLQSTNYSCLLENTNNRQGPRIALIQGHTRADWKNDLKKQRSIMQEHQRLSLSAVEDSGHRDIDLVIWPETAFRQSLVTVAEGYKVPEQIHRSYLTTGRSELAELAGQLNSAVLVGIQHVHLSGAADGSPEAVSFNSAVLVDRQGTVRDTYDKMHRVVLGEYVPFAKWLPVLAQLTPITGAIEAGTRPVAMQLDKVIYATNICYETVVPHLIRQHVVQLSASGKTPHVLVNLTNDAWFWGSSELDLHLACGIFRAVEMRTPLVIAANGGLSAYVDAYGNVLQKTPRQQTAVLLVDLKLPPRSDALGSSDTYPSFYAAHGDWFAIPCMVCCVLAALARNPGRTIDS